jgi:hypothetical protein
MTRRTTIHPASAVLWASAFIIAALVIMQAGRLPSNAAYAEMAASRGDFTLITSDSGRGRDTKPNELLYVIDSRDQVLYVYEIENVRRNQILLRDGGSLNALFRKARP